jgi:thiamine-monophosphate kinase
MSRQPDNPPPPGSPPPDDANSPRPFAPSFATLRDLGEREFIHSIVEIDPDRAAAGAAGVLVDFGDDAAVFQAQGGGPLQVITVDSMAQDTHFRVWTPPEAVGWKLAASNLSDIAAMGARPGVAVVSVAAPATTPVEWLRGLYRGMRAAAKEFGYRLVGGDTIRAEQIVLSLALLGELDEGVKPPLRSNARPGDFLYVTGFPGESGAGLQLEEVSGLRERLEAPIADRLTQRHLHPTPRLVAGQALARSLERVALVDVSDGVLNETELICEASGGLGAILEIARFPLSDALRAFAALAETRAHRMFLVGGEDYELLFACPEPLEEIAAILRADKAGVEATLIGRLRAEPGVVILGPSGEPVEIGEDGFSHF